MFDSDEMMWDLAEAIALEQEEARDAEEAAEESWAADAGTAYAIEAFEVSAILAVPCCDSIYFCRQCGGAK